MCHDTVYTLGLLKMGALQLGLPLLVAASGQYLCDLMLRIFSNLTGASKTISCAQTPSLKAEVCPSHCRNFYGASGIVEINECLR